LPFAINRIHKNAFRRTKKNKTFTVSGVLRLRKIVLFFVPQFLAIVFCSRPLQFLSNFNFSRGVLGVHKFTTTTFNAQPAVPA